MRRRNQNFSSRESRGLSSVWDMSEANVPSDLPTNPVSAASVRVEEPGTDQPVNMSLSERRSDDIPWNEDAYDVYESRVPPPTQVPRSERITPRVGTRFGGDAAAAEPIISDLYDAAGEHEPSQEVMELANVVFTELKDDDEPQRPVPGVAAMSEEVLIDLREAGLDVPIGANSRLNSKQTIAAVAHYFERLSPLPHSYTDSVDGALHLLALLKCPYDDVARYAFRATHLNGAWPIVVEIIYWVKHAVSVVEPLDSLTAGPLFDDELVEDFESYLGFAALNAYLMTQRDDAEAQDAVEEFTEEVRATLIKVNAEDEAKLQLHKDEIATANEEVNMIKASLRSLEELKTRATELVAEISRLEQEVVSARNQTDEAKEVIATLSADARAANTDLMNAKSEIHRLEESLSQNGTISPKEAVELAEAFGDLQSKTQELSSRLKEERREYMDAFEIPSRKLLGNIVAGIEAYNSELDDESLWLPTVENSLDAVAGKSVATLLRSMDLRGVKQKWREIELRVDASLLQMEGELASLDTEIKTLEELRVRLGQKRVELQARFTQAELERDRLNATVAGLRFNSDSRNEKTRRLRDEANRIRSESQTLSHRIETLRQEQPELDAVVTSALTKKRRYYQILIAHRNVYKKLNHEITRYLQAKDEFLSASEDAKASIDGLIPPATQHILESDDEWAAQRALTLLGQES